MASPKRAKTSALLPRPPTKSPTRSSSSIHPKTAARRVALKILVAIESPDTIFPQALGALLPTCPPETRPLVRELASGVLRHRGLLDWTLGPLLKKPLDKLDSPVRAALRLAAYERIILKTFPSVVGNEYSQLMKSERLLSATGFVNAVARRLPNEHRELPDEKADPVRYLSVKYSHWSYFIERWLHRFGFEECEKLLQFNNSIAPLTLRVNTLRCTREEILASLQARGIQAKPGALSPDAIIVEHAGDPTVWPEWDEGKIYVQDEAAQLVALFTDPRPGQTVIDCASAPGGKSTHMAQLMKGEGKIYACDISEGRLKLVRENALRLGMENVETRACNALVLTSLLAPADLVLLDAPCYGTGTLRRRPDEKWNRTATQLAELVELQRELLEAVAPLVKPGGVLVYSTCSIEPEENENQIAWWQERRAGWEVEMRSTLPYRDGCDGMFVARMMKTGHEKFKP